MDFGKQAFIMYDAGLPIGHAHLFVVIHDISRTGKSDWRERIVGRDEQGVLGRCPVRYPFVEGLDVSLVFVCLVNDCARQRPPVRYLLPRCCPSKCRQ